MNPKFVIMTANTQIEQHWHALLSGLGSVSVCRKWPEQNSLPDQHFRCCILDLGLWPSIGESSDFRNWVAHTPTCLLGEVFSIEEELRWLALGVRACCTPDLDDERLRVIVDVTSKGGIWVSNQSLPRLLQGLQHFSAPTEKTLNGATSLSSLTPQERKIAQLVGQGESNKLIARALNISDHTVKTHLSAIFSKLHLNDRVHLALLVNQHNAQPE
ncbi:response regulator transcription factor [Chitinibacter sp. S2-10]|uniref:helix-turn-helix transcriptional regulator n=1 Tax=Chitinibacter sp. S2-10 TaxID=3373597 RepID=UPI0039775602